MLDMVSHTLFRVVRLIMVFAPIGAFGAMAFTIGRYGLSTVLDLGELVAAIRHSHPRRHPTSSRLPPMASARSFQGRNSLHVCRQLCRNHDPPLEMLLTSEGAAGVTGGGFIALAESHV